MATIVETDRIKVEGGTIESFDESHECSNGLINVRKHSRWGYITKDGKKITPIKYDAPADFKEGFARVRYDRGYMNLDVNGSEHEI